MTEVFIVKESYCMDPFQIHRIFSTKELAEGYLEKKNNAKCEDCNGTGRSEDDWDCGECGGAGRGYDDNVFHYVISQYDVDEER